MIREFRLTNAEQQDTMASGAPKIGNRTGWAMSHLKKGALISMVTNHTYRATDKGIAYLKKHAGPITPSDLRKIEGWKEAWDSVSKPKKGKVPVVGPGPIIPPPNITSGLHLAA